MRSFLYEATLNVAASTNLRPFMMRLLWATSDYLVGGVFHGNGHSSLRRIGQRLHKTLEDAGIKLGSVATNISRIKAAF